MRDVRVIERAMGDGVKRVHESELPIRRRLRRATAETI
jgi:N-acetylneuraminate synthase